MSSAEVLNAILQLPPDARREIVFSAWQSLDTSGTTIDEADASEFANEIERRVEAAIQDGDELFDHDDVLRDARRLVSARP